MKTTLTLAAAMLATVLTGCGSAPVAGSDTKRYYYANREAAPVVVTKAVPPPVPQGGPRDAPRSIYFDFDKATIKPEYQPLLDAHVEYLRLIGASRVTVAGYTDERGASRYNLALGQARAEAVRDSLLRRGVPPSQIEAVSWGEQKPVSVTHDEKGWKLDRRVDLVYR